MFNYIRRFQLRARIQILIIILILLIKIQLHSTPIITIDTVSGDTTWTEESKHQFAEGSFNNVDLLSNGTLRIGQRAGSMEDDFSDETKIGQKKHVFVDTSNKEVNLIKIFGTYHSGGHDYGSSVVPTDDGGYIIAGMLYYYGGNAYTNGWVVKTNYKGEMEWDKEFGGAEDDAFSSIIKTSDGGYLLTGWYTDAQTHNRDLYLVKIDKSGNEKWTRTIGGNDLDAGSAALQTSDGGYIIIGTTASYGAGGTDVWLVKTSSTGLKQWDRTFGDGDGEGGADIQHASDGGYIIVGSKTPEGTYKSNLWLLKTDNTGNMQWNKTYGGSESDSGYSVQEITGGGYIVAGSTWSYSSGIYDAWLIKTNNQGEKLWSRVFGASDSDGASKVRQTSDGGYLIAGGTRSYGSGNFDGWLIKTDGNGYQQWSKVIGGAGDDRFWDVQILPDGGYLMTGLTSSYDSYDEDFWLVRTDDKGEMNPEGVVVSNNLLAGHNVSSIDSFSYNASIPAGCTVKVQFSKDNSSWYNSNGNINQFDYLSTGAKTISLSRLHWRGEKFQYKMHFYSKDVNLPVLRYINISFKKYYESGTFDSQEFEASGFGNLKWKSLSFKAAVPTGTEIKFQLRTAMTKEELNSQNYLGPDGTADSYYTLSGDVLWAGHGNDGWIQYRAYLTREDSSESPLLKEVTVAFNYLPAPPTLIKPVNNSWINNEFPVFEWRFSDEDSMGQSSFQWQADDSMGFTSVDFDSGELPSTNVTYKPSEHMADGVWYWRVRTKDSDGDWGPFSEIYILKLDRSIERPLEVNVTPSTWSSENMFTIDWTEPQELAGLKQGAYYFIGYSPPRSQTDGTWAHNKPFVVLNIPNGEHIVYVWLEDLAGNCNYLYQANATLKFDDTPPSIEHEVVTNGNQNMDIALNAKITDKHSGVGNVTVYYRNSAGQTYETLTMSGENETFTATIPCDQVTDENIKYHIKAADNAVPPNIKYFGKDGEVTDEVKPEYDMEIKISSIPFVIDKKPTGNNVAVTALISVIFNEPMDQVSTENAFSISPNVKGQFSWKDNKLMFAPDEYLDYNTTYEVEISKNAKDIEGNSLSGEIKWSFTTMAGDGTTAGNEGSGKSEAGNLMLLVLGIPLVLIIIIVVVYIVIIKKKRQTGDQVINYQSQTQTTAGLQPALGVTVTQAPTIAPAVPNQAAAPTYTQQYTPAYPATVDGYYTPTQTQPYDTYQYSTPTPYSTSQQYGYQQPQALTVYTCELCNASILDPNKCPYCGWLRQF
ncbi:Ig-like domain-containing protein [[Eubacterium] cellulosolvens]